MLTSKTQRWLDLIAFLAGRRTPATVEEIMERVPPYREGGAGADETGRASVRRKFERDKDELRALGVPIETVDYSINYGSERVQGYRLRSRDFYLPWLRIVTGTGAPDEGDAAVPPGPAASPAPRFELREDEARAAVEALHRVAELPSFPFRREALSALRKLTFDLTPEVLGGGSGGASVRYLAVPGSEDLRERLRVLSDALLRRKELRFRYYAIRRDAESDRRVRPYGLLFQHSHWYLVGHDLDREDMRVFRVGRMGSPSVNPRRPRTADYEIPGDFDLDDWAGRPSWALPGQDDEPLDVTVRFEFPRSLWAERNGHGELVEALDDGSHLRLFRVQDRGPFLRWLLGLQDEARIEEPGELDDELRSLARRVAQLHGDPEAGAAGEADRHEPGEGHG